MKKNSFFKNNFIWKESLSNYIGLPRPYKEVDSFFWKKINTTLSLNKNFYLHKKIPIPWQSQPILNIEKNQIFKVIEKNEQLVLKENRCSYCGNIFNDDEICIRWKGWTDNKKNMHNPQGPRLFSDFYPLHIECMKQARIFCPFMRFKEDDEFQIGKYIDLKILADNFRNTFT